MAYYWNMDWYMLTEALLPFLLIFTLIFAVLQRSKILGTDKKNFNVVVALVIALLVVIPHITGTYPYDQDVVRIINSAIPPIAGVMVAILTLMLLVGIWGVEVNWVGGTITSWIALISFLVVVYIFGAAANLWTYTPWLWWLSDPNTQSLIIIILIFAILIWFITKEPKETRGDTFWKKIGEFWKKPK